MDKKTVFVCFDPSDQKQAEAFARLRENSAHSLETQELLCPVNSSEAKPIREEILRKFGQCAKLLVLIGNETYKNAWIEWEILTFHKIKDKVSFGNAWKVIRGMRLADCETAVFPKALESKSTKCLLWEPETLEKWIEE